MDVVEHRGLVGFGLEQCWVRDMSNLAYSKRECYDSQDMRQSARPPQGSSTDEDVESGPYGQAATAIQ